MAVKDDDRESVLIVGAGPSGLMMGYALMRFGIPVVIVEKSIENSPHSRAIAVQIRTLEIFSALGLYEELAKKSLAVGSIEIFREGNGPIKIDIVATTSFFERPLIIDQCHTEKVLLDALSQLGQKVLRGVELVSYRESEDGITAELKNQHGQIDSRSFSYIVGADGAHSVVRKSMSNQFLGSTYDDAFILADAECLHPGDRDSFRIFFKGKRFFAMIPMHGEHHYRLISVRRGETKKAGPLPTIEEFKELAENVVPFPLEIKNPAWVSRFFVQCRSASHYQEDRAFLVGDGAHIHSPAGGQGMNTGLQDSLNLAWKLAMTIKGTARPEILASYQDERKPVGDFLIDRTDRLFKFMVKSSIWARLVRRFILPRAAKSDDIKRRIATIGSQTAIRYETGVLCSNSEHLSRPGIRVGERIPNLTLMSNELKKTDLHKLTFDLVFSCVFFLPKNIAKKRVVEVIHIADRLHKKFPKSLKTVLVFVSDYDAEKTVVENNYFVSIDASWSFQFDEPSYVVVRPDHHVFCLGLLTEIDHAEESLKNFLRGMHL